MSSYPYMVQTAWDAVHSMIEQWQHNPYQWSKERDVQVELASRLKKVYELTGYSSILGNYPKAIRGFENNQLWARVSCEPSISYIYKDGKKYKCYPDVVIWDDIKNPNSPPDSEGDKNWPILWACEIKYDTSTNSSWDLEKMSYLVDQKIVKFGCWLKIESRRTKKGDGINWENKKSGARLWVCQVNLPSL